MRTVDGARIQAVLARQGRKRVWLADRLRARGFRMSDNYLYRILLPTGHPQQRPMPEGFLEAVAEILGVDAEKLLEEDEPAVALAA